MCMPVYVYACVCVSSVKSNPHEAVDSMIKAHLGKESPSSFLRIPKFLLPFLAFDVISHSAIKSNTHYICIF